MPAMAPKEKERLDTYSGRLGAEIRKRRKAKRWDRDELAERVGVSASSVKSWENGIRQIPLDSLPAIAEAFGVSIQALLPKS